MFGIIFKICNFTDLYGLLETATNWMNNFSTMWVKVNGRLQQISKKSTKRHCNLEDLASAHSVIISLVIDSDSSRS